MNRDLVRTLAPMPAAAMIGLLVMSGLFGWWGLFERVAGLLIVGAVIGGIVAHFTKKFAAIPILGGFAGGFGVLLHILLRIQVWFG